MAGNPSSGRLLAALAAAILVTALALPAMAGAKGNASAALGFVESAQNRDGGFGSTQRGRSNPKATVWASVALLAGGKNPRDEFLKDGKSAEDYLAAHHGELRSLEDLALLAIVQETARLGASRFGSPAKKLAGRLSVQAVRADPSAAALAVFALLAAGDRSKAAQTAQALAGSRTFDGAWGPNGNADSASTALVLQALAATRTASPSSAEAKGGLAYLHRAQNNDGAITASTRADKATTGGSVAATAFTVQALKALRAGTLRTSGGKTVRDGLTQYQQESSGGLTSRGSVYSPVPPSVVETAQAFPAFDGVTFPLKPVVARTAGPNPAKRTNTRGVDESSERASSGSAEQGVGGDAGPGTDPGAYKGASANGSGRGSPGKRSSAAPAGERGGPKRRADSPAGAAKDILGTVVSTGPRLASKAGASDTGMTNQQRATLVLGSALGVLFILGAYLERLRPAAAGAALSSGAVAVSPLGRAVLRATGIEAARSGRGGSPRRRWALLAVLAVGAALVALPFSLGMFDRAPKGAAMIDAFEAYMTEARLDGYRRHVRDLDAYAQELRGHPELVRESPQADLFAQQWPLVHARMTRLLDTIEANRENYDAAAALPRFDLMPWFFVAPGALLMLLAAAGLVLGRRAWGPLRRATIALAAGLLLAPFLFQMPDRAPKGAEMVEAFRTVETRANVQQIQGDFGTLSIGAGAIRTDLEPALRQRGLSGARLRRELPATARLNEGWTRILNDMTPMIGVMSDNVGNYRAVTELPSFRLFPLFFVIPGLLVAGLALVAGTRPVRVAPTTRAVEAAAA